MDNWNAPQWADFNASVRSNIDDFFNTEHKEHELELSNDMEYENIFTNSPNFKVMKNSSHDTPRSNGFASPMPTGSSRKANSRMSKTNDSLINAMHALQIKSAKKSLTRRSMTPSSLGVMKKTTVSTFLTTSVTEDDENIETEIKEAEDVTDTEVCQKNCTKITPQELPQEVSTSVNNTEEENTDHNSTLVASNRDKDLCTPIKKTDIVAAKSIRKSKIDAGNSELSHELPTSEEHLNDAQSKLEIRIDPLKREILDKKNAKLKSNKPRVLTSQVRRHSIAKYRRRSNQYVSLAEAVARFQNGTPKRFRSTSQKNKNAGPPSKSKPTKIKLTCPMSPALRCKSRTRPISSSNLDSKCAPVKLNSKPSFPRASTLPKEKSSNKVKPLIKINKISTTSGVEQKATTHSPKVILKEIDKMLGGTNSTTDTNIISIMSESMRKLTPCKKSVPTIVSTDEGMEIKDVKILHFGIPVGTEYKKITRPKPFSFDTRNKELQSKREKLKNQQSTEETSRKSLFHAKPPASLNTIKKTTSVLKAKDDNANNGGSIVRTLSFQERNELALKKKKELMDQIVEQEKKARIFHAKPAPNFKSVIVRGKSTENLRSGDDNNKVRTRGISPSSRNQGQSQLSVANQENTAPILANQQCPKLKNPLMTQNLKVKKTAK